jgi:hypothetical protein
LTADQRSGFSLENNHFQPWARSAGCEGRIISTGILLVRQLSGAR